MIVTIVFKSTFKIICNTSHTIIEGKRKNRNINEGNNWDSINNWLRNVIMTRKLYKNNKIKK
jgi:hypothetical protein